MLITRSSAAAVLAGLTFTLGACGSEDGPTREEFATQANEICADLEKAAGDVGSPENFREISQLATDTQKRFDEAVQRLERLEVPEGEAGEQAQAFVDEMRATSEEQFRPAFEDLREAAEANDPEEVQAAAERVQELDTSRVNELAREAGADGCGG